MLLETFGQLARDPAHWQFELFVGFIEMLVFDVVVGTLLWPAIKDHIHRDINRSHRFSREPRVGDDEYK